MWSALICNRRRLGALMLATGLVAAAPSMAQDIVLAHVAPYTGPLMKDATDIGLGAKVAINAVNDHGGVLGRKFRIITADDHFKPDETVQLVRSMIGKASALLPMTGTANIEKMLKDGVLDNVTLPVVGMFPSPDYLRNWSNRNLFHIRAGDRDQMQKIIEQLTSVGITDIGVIAPSTPFGQTAVSLAEELLQKRNLQLKARGIVTLGAKIDLEPAVKAVMNKGLAAILLLAPPGISGQFVRELRSRGETAMIFAMSYSDANLIVKIAGKEYAHGVAIAQVMPNPANRSVPLVKAFREDFAKYAKTTDEPSFLTLEGYVSTRLIIEAIRRSKDASAEGVRRGLEMLHNYDLGGYIVDFAPDRHIGSQFVDLSVIGGAGKLLY